MIEELKFEFNDYIVAIDEPYENDCGYVAIGKKDKKDGFNIWFTSLNEQTVDFYIELQKYITNLQSQLAEKDKEIEQVTSKLPASYEKQQNQKAIEQLEKVKKKILSYEELYYQFLQSGAKIPVYCVENFRVKQTIDQQIEEIKAENERLKNEICKYEITLMDKNSELKENTKQVCEKIRKHICDDCVWEVCAEEHCAVYYIIELLDQIEKGE